MALFDDLTKQVQATFTNLWQEQSTTSIPSPDALQLNANHAKNLASATVLYADLDGSTNMVDSNSWTFSAEVYKCYLHCAAQIIRGQGGTITAYDGDRVMGIFVGDLKNTRAVKAALMINHAVENIIRPSLKSVYTKSDFIVKHAIGIDTSPLHAARIGVKGDNDIVWIGRAANYAAKLTALPIPGPLWITSDVYDMMDHSVKVSSTTPMWEKFTWKNMTIYRSTWRWTRS